MVSLRSSIVLFFLMVITLMSGILHGEPAKDRDRERIDALVRQLGHDKYPKREAARKELEVLGEKALPAIREAQGSRDLNFNTLAKQLTRSIMARSGKSKTTGMELVVID